MINAAVDIVLVNYNGAEDTIECIESLMQMNHQNFRILVVENGSTDDSKAVLTEYTIANSGEVLHPEQLPDHLAEERLILMLSEENRGFAAGNNIAMRFSQQSAFADYVWLLNNDTKVDQEALTALINTHVSKSKEGFKVGVLGSKVLFYDQPEMIQTIGGYLDLKVAKVKLLGSGEIDSGQYDGYDKEFDMVLGASMFVSMDFLSEVGLLNEEYFLYFEELDWSIRAKMMSFCTLCATSSVVFHKQGRATKNSFQSKGKSEFAMFYQFSNLIRFYQKFYPKQAYRAKLRVLIRLSKFALAGELNFWRMFNRVFLKHE